MKMKVRNDTLSDLDQSPLRIVRELPSLARLVPHLPGVGMDVWASETSQKFVEAALKPNKATRDMECRLAIAQILKDVHYQHQLFPRYVSEAFNQIMPIAVLDATDDTIDLLLALGIDLNRKCNNQTLLEVVCRKSRRIYVAERLVNEGCDCSVLKGSASRKNLGLEAMRYWSMLEDWDQQNQVRNLSLAGEACKGQDPCDTKKPPDQNGDLIRGVNYLKITGIPKQT